MECYLGEKNKGSIEQDTRMINNIDANDQQRDTQGDWQEEQGIKEGMANPCEEPVAPVHVGI